MNAISFDSHVFRRALGCFPTGVTIITARGTDQRPVGMTCNSFSSVSLEPPLVQWSIAKSSRSHHVICAAEHFAVHILNTAQRDLCQRFSSKDQDRFAAVDLEIGLQGLPLLKHYHARFECETYGRHDAGDHTLIIGRVLRLCEQEGEPLIFYRGAFGCLGTNT